MASPVTAKAEDPQDTIGPAVSGTTGILESVLRFGGNVKRIVITSSSASATEPKDGPYTYTEVSGMSYFFEVGRRPNGYS